MRVLHLIDHWGLGGAQRALATLVAAEAAQRHRIVSVFAHGRYDWPLPPGCRLDFLAQSYAGLPLAPARLRRLMAAWRPHILQAHLSGARFVAARAMSRRSASVRLVWHEHSGAEVLHRHGPLAGGLALRLQRRLARAARAVVANSEASRQFCAEHLGVPADKLRVLYCPVDAEAIRAEGEKEPVDPPATFARGGGPVLGFIGRLAEQKDPAAFLDLCAALIRRGFTGAFWVVGEGPLEPALRRKARRLGLAERVVFWGGRQDVFAIVAKMDAVAMPSRYEPFGLVALEAFALGVPVAGYAVDGLAEVLANHLHAFPCPAGDLQALVQAAEAALAAKHQARPGLPERFETHRVMADWSRFYRELLQESDGA